MICPWLLSYFQHWYSYFLNSLFQYAYQTNSPLNIFFSFSLSLLLLQQCNLLQTFFFWINTLYTFSSPFGMTSTVRITWFLLNILSVILINISQCLEWKFHLIENLSLAPSPSKRARLNCLNTFEFSKYFSIANHSNLLLGYENYIIIIPHCKSIM